jgi:hypothetical protein
LSSFFALHWVFLGSEKARFRGAEPIFATALVFGGLAGPQRNRLAVSLRIAVCKEIGEASRATSTLLTPLSIPLP